MNEFTEEKSIRALKNKGPIPGSEITRATNSWSLKSVLRKSHYICPLPTAYFSQLALTILRNEILG